MIYYQQNIWRKEKNVAEFVILRLNEIWHRHSKPVPNHNPNPNLLPNVNGNLTPNLNPNFIVVTTSDHKLTTSDQRVTTNCGCRSFDDVSAVEST